MHLLPVVFFLIVHLCVGLGDGTQIYSTDSELTAGTTVQTENGQTTSYPQKQPQQQKRALFFAVGNFLVKDFNKYYLSKVQTNRSHCLM